MKTEIEIARQAVLTDVTATGGEGHDPDDDPVLSRTIAYASATFLTKSNGESNEPDEDDETAFAARLTLTTCTSASGHPTETDPEDDAHLLRAMTTTLTESTGDRESDPEDDDVGGTPGRVSGSMRPLAFRFAETVECTVPALAYDPITQVHVLPSGAGIIETFERELRANT